jgi:predicted branched-subunit amino acid permease
MAASTAKSAYLRGLRDGAPFLIMAIPFALVFGVVAMDAGLQLSQTLGFSILVVAGASQFAALQMMLDDATIAVVLMAALAVNLRMAMYSASLVPHLGNAPLWQRAVVSYLMFDQSYVMSLMEYERVPAMSVAEKLGYYLGVASLIAPMWMIATAIGALVGAQIPPGYALDFIVPIMFLAMVGPMLKTLAHVGAAFTSAALGLLLAGLPSGMGLLMAAGFAMAVGAVIEVWSEGRA